MKKYIHTIIEPKWQKVWEKEKSWQAEFPTKKKKFYGLIEFPFLSGDGLHVGHVRSYTALDIVARKKRSEGLNVLYPIGYDAFGLPIENFAIKTGKTPSLIVKNSSNNFRRQLKSLGFAFDWSREINTSDPKYYKWTQWMFLQFFKKGLAYKTKMPINWCLNCKIGLANEEVVDGMCERCGGPTEKREKEQWMIAITKYADRLDKDLDSVDYSPRIKTQQRNWIGKSDGAEIGFQLVTSQIDADSLLKNADREIRSYIMGVNNIDSELLSIGIKIYEKTNDGNYKVTIPKNKIADYKKLIAKVLKPGFWNEYIGDKTAFIFKNKSGKIERFVWDKNTEKKLLKLCNKYAKANFKSIRSMLEDNNWYKDILRGFAENLRQSATLSSVNVFTTRADTLFGATYLVLAPEHPLIKTHIDKIENSLEVNMYIEFATRKDEKERTDVAREKTGVKLEGLSAINPANNEEIPIYVADYVLPHYGTGAIMAVPAHDERDFEFATLHRLPIKKVVLDQANLNETLNAPYTGMGILSGSGKFDGLESEKAKVAITKFVSGKLKVAYKLRDWVFSRQRYWGEPIPIINCGKCGYVAIPEKSLPLKLPIVKKYQPTESGESPLAGIASWVNVKCPKCKGPAKRETDTMPNWAGSSWYFLRYADPKNDKEFASKKALKYWMTASPVRGREGSQRTFTSNGVDWYNGGMEHTTLHLLYSRFWHKFLYDLKLVPTKEPYKKRTSHGLILAEGGIKMSKSKGNVINPDEIVKVFGADSLRLYEMFMGPFEQAISWSQDGLVGTSRFLEKVWRLQDRIKNKELSMMNKELETLIHQSIKKVGEDIESLKMNTAVSQLMILTNELEKQSSININSYKILLRLLAPFAPHITEEIWAALKEKKSIHLTPWPKFDNKKIEHKIMTVGISVNGKMRGQLKVPHGAKENEILKLALNDEALKKWLISPLKRHIYVPGKIINLVI